MLPLSTARARRVGALTIAVGVLAAGTAVLTAAPANAHDQLTGSAPAAGSTLTAAPSEVRLAFTDEVKELGLTVLVTDQAGASVTAGTPTIEGTDVVAPLDPIVASGRYAVAYRVVSADGHPISGTFSFTVRLPSAGPTPSAVPSTSPPTPTPTASPETSGPATSPPATAAAAVVPSGGGGPAWVVAGVGLLAVLVVIGVVLVRRRAS